MKEPTRVSDEPSRLGCLAALSLSFLPLAIMWVNSGDAPTSELLFLLPQGFLLALPFWYLGLEGSKARLPWLVAIGLSVLFGGALIASVVINRWRGTGVDFLTPLIVIFMAPIFTTYVVWRVVQLAKESADR